MGRPQLTDPRALRAYAHPFRLTITGLLRREGTRSRPPGPRSRRHDGFGHPTQELGTKPKPQPQPQLQPQAEAEELHS
ncbi:hypothetical protein ABT404_49405 [Streptomyces hyaluromycini]|uniref:Transposase n=1 Tax=Streptomyces hyaluromycini TaxID=1377993 RepID=A0ABV1XEE4_9ACTN